MEDRSGVVLAGIEESIVKSSREIFALLDQGSAKRRTAETLLNKQSSRSHSGGWVGGWVERMGRWGVGPVMRAALVVRQGMDRRWTGMCASALAVGCLPCHCPT